jgi:GntR family carbon starvation induced transcriptional regulator
MRILNDNPNAPVTESEAAAMRLRRDILSGALAPEIKLKVRELTERYRIGASPIREALAQLAASGFVIHQGQRGFRVSPISTQNLIDITESRKIIEAEALRLAMQHANSNWEDEIVASYHLFERQVSRFYDGDDEHLDNYEDKHHRFHRALIAACPLEMLKKYCDDLYLRKTRYRVITRSYVYTKDAVIEEHRILKDAILSRDEEAAAKALKLHIGITAEVIQKLLPQTDQPIELSALIRQTTGQRISATKPRLLPLRKRTRTKHSSRKS